MQQGLVARFHLREIGCSNEHWWRARRNGRWEVLSPRVLRVRGVAESDDQRALAAVLDACPGAVLHGRSALAWWGLGGHDLSTVHVARPRGMSGNPVALAHLHRLREVRPHDVVVVRGVPTETAFRAIWVEAARYAPEPLMEIGLRRIGRLLDDANVRRLVTWEALHGMVDDLRRKGRAGTRIMTLLAEARPAGSSPGGESERGAPREPRERGLGSRRCAGNRSSAVRPRSGAATSGTTSCPWRSRSTASPTTRRPPTGGRTRCGTSHSTTPGSPWR